VLLTYAGANPGGGWTTSSSSVYLTFSASTPDGGCESNIKLGIPNMWSSSSVVVGDTWGLAKTGDVKNDVESDQIEAKLEVVELLDSDFENGNIKSDFVMPALIPKGMSSSPDSKLTTPFSPKSVLGEEFPSVKKKRRKLGIVSVRSRDRSRKRVRTKVGWSVPVKGEPRAAGWSGGEHV